MVINVVSAQLTCPRCGATSETDIEACIDGYGPANSYRVGDTVTWNPFITQEYQGRPPLGDLRVEGYAECPVCKKDYFVEIVIERDKITRATPISDKPGYIP